MSISPKKIYIVSTIFPSGISWLANCFLELNLKVYREQAPEDFWLKDDNGYYLNPRENYMKRWLPAVWFRQYFNFIEEYEIYITESLPLPIHSGEFIILFLRNPNDSLFSYYKRFNTNIDIFTFSELFEPIYMLNKYDYLTLFYISWYFFKGNKIVTSFENYKNDPYATLVHILKSLNLNFNNSQIEDAIKNSDFNIAKYIENKYIETYGNDNPRGNVFINRAGKINEFNDEQIIINNQINNILYNSFLNNSNNLDNLIITDYKNLIKLHSFYHSTLLPKELLVFNTKDDAIIKLFNGIQNINHYLYLMKKSNYLNFEIETFLTNLNNIIKLVINQ